MHENYQKSLECYKMFWNWIPMYVDAWIIKGNVLYKLSRFVRLWNVMISFKVLDSNYKNSLGW
jgi:hypothetical protein